jgi:hypothetical protein
MVAGYLEDRWVERANVARFWRTLPIALKPLPEIEFRRMREFAVRSIEAESKAVEAAKMGIPTPGRRGNPPSGDQRDIDDGF